MTSKQRKTRELFDNYSGLIYSKCLRMLGNREDAADAVQETFTKAFCALDTLRQQESQLSWLYRIATTTCLNLIRTRKRKGAVLLEEVGSLVAQGNQPLDNLLLQRVFQALQDQCDERTLEIFVAFDKKQTGTIQGSVDLGGAFSGKIKHSYASSLNKTYSTTGTISGGKFADSGKGSLYPNPKSVVAWKVTFSF